MGELDDDTAVGAAERVPAPAKSKGRFTIRTAAALFMLSAVLELASIRSAEPVIGTVLNGVPAMGYHVIYAVLFGTIGYGLWQAETWALKAIVVGGIVYSVDRLGVALDPASMSAYLQQQLGGVLPAGAAEMHLMLRIIVLAYVLFVAGWWAFAGYLYLRRGYFGRTPPAQ